ncbi:MAG: SDR family oxidoreductase [Proteobacteria bacterium]|nr:SDR family oxidoreductase [Pseudomonadota bacterium]
MKSIIVTGGTKGLGLQIVKTCRVADYNIIVIARTVSAEFEELVGHGKHLHFIPFDLSQESGYQDLVRSISRQHGTIYGLVNNAAVGLDGVLATMHEADIERLVTTNLTSCMLLTKYVSRSMLLKREGRIINISSIIATTGFNGLSVYAATKAALQGFTKSLARELGKAGVLVNSVSPGYMQTQMTSGLGADEVNKIKNRSPLRRLVSPLEVAEVVAFLLSEKASGITGEDIRVDAGSSC